MKKIFTFSDGQIVLANGYDDIQITGLTVEQEDANHIPDQLFFDALKNNRLYDLKKTKTGVQILRNKKKRTADEPIPVITDEENTSADEQLVS